MGGGYSMFAQYKKQIPCLWLWYNHSCHCVAVMSILMWHSVFIFVCKFHWHKALPRRGRLCFDLVYSVKKRGSRNPQWEPSRSQINISSSIYSTYWLPGGNFYANNHIHCCGWKFFIPGQKKKMHQRTDLDLQMVQAYFEPFKSTPPLHWKTFKCSWSVGGELRESCSYQCSVQDKMLRWRCAPGSCSIVATYCSSKEEEN